MQDQLPQEALDRSFRDRLAGLLELLVGSSFGAAVIYSLFWGAFQSLAVGHYILNETRFVAVSSATAAKPLPAPAPQPAAKTSSASDSSDDSDTSDSSDTGEALEIWFGSAQHRGLFRPCTVDFEFTGTTLTNYKFGSDRRTNPHQARYLPVQGFAKTARLPGPYLYLHFESALGSSRTYQLDFDFKKDASGKVMAIAPGSETFLATATTGLTPWECIGTVFLGGGIKLTDFSDFTFAKVD